VTWSGKANGQQKAGREGDDSHWIPLFDSQQSWKSPP
jgi:hypothetical protein